MTHLPTPERENPPQRPREVLQRRLELVRAATADVAPSDLVLCRVDVPRVDPAALLSRFGDRDVVLWQPPEGPCFAGIDVAHAIAGEGLDRFDHIRRAGVELWARLRLDGRVRSGLDSPRLFGGFAFSPLGARSEQWKAFGAARFVLPRVTYAAGADGAVLTLAIERAELERGSESPSVQLFQRVIEVAHSQPEPVPSREALILARSEPPASAFQLRVEDLLARIARGEFEKVVAARDIQLEFAKRLDPLATVIALREHAPECLRFLFRLGDSSFLGGTPERLLHKRGQVLETEALAGSIAAGDDGPEHRLQASSKELEEHALVVSAIARALVPLSEQTKLPERPLVRRLKHILHLSTPITARLKQDTHALDLLEKLHPTPAVGGVPTEGALAWIAEREPFDRGWYSGAVGWFDAWGDGDFHVALRSGLLRGKEAWLYAGAGIVRDSVAAAEYAETTLKFSVVLASLRTPL
jgi:isochorismate synthase